MVLAVTVVRMKCVVSMLVVVWTQLVHRSGFFRDVGLLFRRLASGHTITTAATTSDAPIPRPTPKPAFTPVERPSSLATLFEDEAGAAAAVDALFVVLVVFVTEEADVEDTGPSITTSLLFKKTPCPAAQHLLPFSSLLLSKQQ